MIRLANKTDLFELTSMLYTMYHELFEEATSDYIVYREEMVRCINDPKQWVYIDDEARGFFIVMDQTEPMTPDLIVYNGTRVFVKKEYRNTRVLKEFYDRLFKDFNGVILGMTNINSKHIPVMDKRHELIAKVYKLNRSN